MINVLKIFFPGNSKVYLVLFLIGLIITPVFIEAQGKSQDVLTLERIYKRNEFRLNRFGPVRWNVIKIIGVYYEKNTFSRSNGNSDGSIYSAGPCRFPSL